MCIRDRRSGSEVTFDLQKIINAINGANSEVKSSERPVSYTHLDKRSH